MRDESTIYKKKIGDVSMKKKVLTFIILFVLCRLNTGLCQEYLTLEQLKQQTPPRWVETYQDRYGRSTAVDIDIQIHGNTDAAIYKLKLPYNQEVRCSNNNPYNSVENVRRKGGRRAHIYTSFGEKIDVYFPYGKDYGNNMTPSEMYAFLGERLANEGINLEEFECTYPAQFDVLCNLSQSDGHTIASAFYHMELLQKINEMPLLTHAIASFKKRGSPDFCPNLTFLMRNENEYSLYVNKMSVESVVAEDIPLCSFEKIQKTIEEKIEKGYIQRIYSLKFGYSIYNAKRKGNKPLAAYDAECYYAVPSWVIDCVYMVDPKKTFDYHVEEELKRDPDANERYSNGFKTITINAQTGEMLDPLDTSDKGWGDANYKGFIPWDKVKK